MYFSEKLGRKLAFEYFISKKTLKSVIQGKKVSKPIVRISVISISLAVIVNLVTIAVVTGFQQKVREKIAGFGSHIYVMNSSDESIMESESIRKDQKFIELLKNDPAIKSINPVGYKPILLQSSKNEIKYKLANGKDTSEIQQDIFGAVIKGVEEKFDWTFYKDHLVEGWLPKFTPDAEFSELLISKRHADLLHYSIGDTIRAFFVRNQPVLRKFRISGIYETGLEEFDKKFVIGDLRLVQELNDWGIQATIELADTLYDEQLIITSSVTGGNGNYRYDWGKGFDTYSGIVLFPQKDTVIRLIVSDFWNDIREEKELTSLADTAFLEIQLKGKKPIIGDFKLNSETEIERMDFSSDGHAFSLFTELGEEIRIHSIPGKGSSSNYVGGFEVMINNWSELDETFDRIRKKIDFYPTKHGEVLKTTSIKENEAEIFVWLDFLDINVWIILVLMIIIGIINMGSALLVLILIRSQFIGLLKAMGATNNSIRKIFLYQATFLIGRGMIYGNVIGLIICFAQKYLGLITLNPEVYYLDKVPIELELWQWFALNVGTLIVCVSALIIPSLVIARINPVKAIKFN